MTAAISLSGGAVLGFASSLHCVGMCGGISVLLGGGGTGCGLRAAGGRQALLHGGRLLSYALLGATAGGIGSTALGDLDPGSAPLLLRWAAAASLGWIGLATAGLAPAPAWLGHAHAGVTPGHQAMRALLRLPLPVRRIAGGLAWGLMPCGMVYGALLFAMFAGTALGGMLVMLGFGLGTLPALAAASLGFARLQSVLRAHEAERWLGAALLLLAVASLVESPAALGAYCAHLASPFRN